MTRPSSLDTTAAPPPPAPAAEAPSSPGAGGRLKRLVLRASVYQFGGYAATQVLRLGSNLVLSRLLFPEAFGLVALVNIFNQALVMLSDVGLKQAVIQSPRGDEPAYLNTAFTVQVIRGFILYGVALLMAWPLALLYRHPELTWLLCAGSLGIVVNGLASTSLFTLQRRLSLRAIAAIDVGAQAASIAVMIPWAYFHRSPWALVAGVVTGPVFRTVASHLVRVGYRNRLELEPAARSQMFHFGKWIFASSAVYFLGQQGDRILLGRFMGVVELGIYSVAVLLSDSVRAAIVGLTSGVLFPALSRIHEEGIPRLRHAYYRARLALDVLSLPALGALTVLGPWVVHLLYDHRYAGAGWILQAFAFRVATACMISPCETCLFSMGQTRYGFYQSLARLAWIVVAIPVGWHFLGLRGIVYGTALSELPLLLVVWPPFRKAGMLRPLLELRAVAFYAAGLGLGGLLSLVLHP